MQYCIVLTLILLFEGDKQEAAWAPTQTDALIVQFRDGTVGERSDAKLSLLRCHDKPLSAALQKELFNIFAKRNLPSEVRTDAMYVLLETTAALAAFEESLQKIAALNSESVEIRVSAIFGLQIILRSHAGKAVSTNLLFKILADQNQPASIRVVAGNAIFEDHTSRDKLFKVLAKLVASPDESYDARFQMLRLIPLAILSTPKNCESLATVLMQLAVDTTESVHFRNEALNCLAAIVAQIEFDSIDMTQMSERLSRELTKLVADPENHRRIREAAGQALCVCPKVDAVLLTALNEMLISQERYIHEYAARALMSFGKEAKSSVPRLINIWNDMRESKETHEAVEDALLAIDPAKAGQLGITEK